MTRWTLPLFIRWKGTIFGTFALVLAAGTALALSAPPVFESRSTILVDRTIATEPVQSESSRRHEILAALETERRVILSRQLAEAVVVELGLASRLAAPAGPIEEALGVVGSLLPAAEGVSERERWIQRLSTGLKVSAEAPSRTLTVRYANGDPDLAKSVVAAVAQQYVNQRLGVSAEPNLREYYAGKVLDLRQRHARLNALQELNPVRAIGANRSQLVMDSQALQERISELKGELNALQGQKSVTTGGLTRPQFVFDSQTLQGRISELKNDLQERRDGSSDAGASSITRLRDEVSIVGSGLERLGNQIDRLGTEVTLTQNLGFMIDAVEQQLIDYQAKYAGAATERGTSELINVEIVERATDATPSVLPNPSYLLAAFIAALLAGLLAALLRQFLGGQIRSAAQVEEILSLPVYGSVGRYQT